MISVIPNILDEEKVKQVRELMKTSVYIEGKATAGDHARSVKDNEQVYSEAYPVLNKIAMGALIENERFKKESFAKIISNPLFSKYETGRSYGPHTDDPLMKGRYGPFRCDIAMTLFLSDPHEYDGGELCTMGQKVKLPAGTLFMYPADSTHCVLPVTRGTRYVMVTWCQSMVKDHSKREILSELSVEPENPDFERINHAYTKLVRMWAEV